MKILTKIMRMNENEESKHLHTVARTVASSLRMYRKFDVGRVTGKNLRNSDVRTDPPLIFEI